MATKTNSDGSWKQHKYVDRVQTKSGGWRYIYDNQKLKSKPSYSVSRSYGKSGLKKDSGLNKSPAWQKHLSTSTKSIKPSLFNELTTLGLSLLLGHNQYDKYVERKNRDSKIELNTEAHDKLRDPNNRKLTKDEQDRLSKWRYVSEKEIADKNIDFDKTYHHYVDENGAYHVAREKEPLETIFRHLLTMEYAAQQVNPNYASSREYRVNCPSCSVVYELNRRGYSYEADDNDGECMPYIRKYFDGEEPVLVTGDGIVHKRSKQYDYGSSKDHAIEDEYRDKGTIPSNFESFTNNYVRKMPSGSRGVVLIDYEGGGGGAYI